MNKIVKPTRSAGEDSQTDYRYIIEKLSADGADSTLLGKVENLLLDVKQLEAEVARLRDALEMIVASEEGARDMWETAKEALKGGEGC